MSEKIIKFEEKDFDSHSPYSADVNFLYFTAPSDGTWLLKGVTFTLKKNEMVNLDTLEKVKNE